MVIDPFRKCSSWISVYSRYPGSRAPRRQAEASALKYTLLLTVVGTTGMRFFSIGLTCRCNRSYIEYPDLRARHD